MFILSYTHSEKFSQLVQDLWPWERNFADIAITTSERTGRGGKVWAIEQLCEEDSKVWHADDNADVCDAILDLKIALWVSVLPGSRCQSIGGISGLSLCTGTTTSLRRWTTTSRHFETPSHLTRELCAAEKVSVCTVQGASSH